MALQGQILVVDDQVALAENIAEVLAMFGYRSAVASSAAEALLLFNDGVAALITDFRMPEMSGAELIAEIRRRGSQIPALVITAHTDDGTIRASTDAGATTV